MRSAVLFLLMFLPSGLRVICYRSFFRWRIGRGVKIGFSYIDCAELEIGDNVHIGHFNVFRKTRKLTIGNETFIGSFNQISGSGTYYDNFPCAVSIGRRCFIMSRHFIDSSGIVTIDNGVTLAGRDTQVWSHSQVMENEPQLAPLTVEIGGDTYVGARATLVGCKIPPKAVVGAGSVVTKDFSDVHDRVLIAGNPGKVVKNYATEGA
jgi:acetyltransferase-like isoleucine patch superfamily enzyme